MLVKARTLIIRFRDEPGDTCPICHIGTLSVCAPNLGRSGIRMMYVLGCTHDRKHWRTATDQEVMAHERVLDNCTGSSDYVFDAFLEE